MTETLVGKAVRYAQQLDDVATPYNRSAVPGTAGAQRIALERVFDGTRAWGPITASEEWAQLQGDSPLHEDQFKAFVEQHAAQAESTH